MGRPNDEVQTDQLDSSVTRMMIVTLLATGTEQFNEYLLGDLELVMIS
jgi:hypothetical protein